MTTAFDRATARPAITLPNLRRLPLRAIGIAGAAAVAIAAGATWIAAPASSVSTDDAYVKADSTIVAPRVQGLISEILVRDNQTVTAGQALVRIDTTDPPGNETKAVEYIRQVLDAEGIPVIVTAKDPARANLIARLKGNGSKRPILLLGHTDTVKVDPSKWTFPPFSATRDGGWV